MLCVFLWQYFSVLWFIWCVVWFTGVLCYSQDGPVFVLTRSISLCRGDVYFLMWAQTIWWFWTGASQPLVNLSTKLAWPEDYAVLQWSVVMCGLCPCLGYSTSDRTFNGDIARDNRWSRYGEWKHNHHSFRNRQKLSLVQSTLGMWNILFPVLFLFQNRSAIFCAWLQLFTHWGYWRWAFVLMVPDFVIGCLDDLCFCGCFFSFQILLWLFSVSIFSFHARWITVFNLVWFDLRPSNPRYISSQNFSTC